MLKASNVYRKRAWNQERPTQKNRSLRAPAELYKQNMKRLSYWQELRSKLPWQVSFGE